ncbi:hypothetical protein [Heliobacterium mobile]|nr:hypothetical protein [Heliobacterium mobile]
MMEVAVPETLHMDSSQFAMLLFIALIVGAMVFSFLRRLYVQWITYWRMRVGRVGEQQAAKLLKQEGYSVIKAQPAGRMTMRVDGRPVEISVRADYLVTGKGKTFIAEVKTGDRAPRPTHGDTRRQLLEYSLVYQVDGVLLVDMAAKKIHRIEFEYAS